MLPEEKTQSLMLTALPRDVCHPDIDEIFQYGRYVVAYQLLALAQSYFFSSCFSL